jgi:hypothetical protein
VLREIFLIVGLSILVMSPWLVRMICFAFSSGNLFYNYQSFYYFDTFITDAVAIFIPHQLHLLGNAFSQISSKFTGLYEAVAYLGWINLIVIGSAYKNIWEKISGYFYAAIVFMMLAMGAHLHILGRKTFISLPYELIKYLPFFQFVRTPARAMVYVYLFLAIMVAFSLSYLTRNHTWKIHSKLTWLFIAIYALIYFDYYTVCNQKTRVDVPAVYKYIERGGEQFGILDLPFEFYAFQHAYMMYQTIHGIPIVTGNITNKAKKTLVDYLILADIEAQRKQLVSHRIKYIIIHKGYPLDSGFIPTVHLQHSIASYKKYYAVAYEDDESVLLKVY